MLSWSRGAWSCESGCDHVVCTSLLYSANAVIDVRLSLEFLLTVAVFIVVAWFLALLCRPLCGVVFVGLGPRLLLLVGSGPLSES